jgi:hypothetical protein
MSATERAAGVEDDTLRSEGFRDMFTGHIYVNIKLLL